jgi:Asp-tRNA(Asn)/Glu-tRNA(Gln) amidotransferase A subunit family amidase
MESLTTLSVTEMARRIQARQLLPVDLVEAHIARIEAINPAINALVVPNFAEARRQAVQATAELDSGTVRSPLQGIPFTVKDGYDVAGLPNACGLLSRAGHLASSDSPLVSRMHAAGAILLGKTNVPDNCSDLDTTNLLFGPTRNPWDQGRSAGGSSGGEAAIIAAGGSPLGLGSDIGGSIRLPAHFTGIVGLKPTSFALPVENFWPPLRGRLNDLVALGPMARHVEDVALAFAVLRGENPQPLDPQLLRGERVAGWHSDGIVPSSAAVRGAVTAAIAALKAAGMQAVAGAPAGRRLAGLGWAAYNRAAERQAWAEGFGNGEAWSPGGELLRAWRGWARISPGPLLMWLISSYSSRAAIASGIDGARWRADLRAQLVDLIGERGIAVCPVFPFAAPRLGWTVRWLAIATLSSFTTWVNLAGLPALSVPLGRSRHNGLPLGVQLVGAPGAEQILLAAGLVIERAVAETAGASRER